MLFILVIAGKDSVVSDDKSVKIFGVPDIELENVTIFVRAGKDNVVRDDKPVKILALFLIVGCDTTIFSLMLTRDGIYKDTKDDMPSIIFAELFTSVVIVLMLVREGILIS